MGFFSWDCKGCDNSIKAPHPADWQSKAVVLFPNGDRVSGQYDGYGRVGSAYHEVDLSDCHEFSIYHAACHRILQPAGYTGPSCHANDQGFFSDDNSPEPQSTKDIVALRAAEKARNEKRKREWQEARIKMIEEYRAKGEPLPAWLGA